MYWAVASSPTGPFSAPHVATCGNAAGWEAIDPTVYQTASGRSYLVWKRGHYHPGFPDGTFQIRARKLTFSGSSAQFTGGGSPSLILAQIPDGTVMEAPSLVAHGGKVWLFVSRGRFDTNDYHTDAWVAKSFGPGFTFSNHVMATGQGYGFGPGGAEVITDAGGSVRIAYHVWETASQHPRQRGRVLSASPPSPGPVASPTSPKPCSSPSWVYARPGSQRENTAAPRTLRRSLARRRELPAELHETVPFSLRRSGSRAIVQCHYARFEDPVSHTRPYRCHCPQR